MRALFTSGMTVHSIRSRKVDSGVAAVFLHEDDVSRWWLRSVTAVCGEEYKIRWSDDKVKFYQARRPPLTAYRLRLLRSERTY